MGYSLSDRPFSVVKSLKDVKNPFCVCFDWHNNKGFKSRTVRINGKDEERMDSDTYYMSEILERHATLSAAQKSMRKFATEAFAKVNVAPSYGEVCHNSVNGGTGESKDTIKLRVGDVVQYTHIPGVVWQVKGEKRKDDAWYTVIVPVFSFLVHNGTDNKERELRTHDVYHYIHHVNIVELGTLYTKLGLFLQDEARRRSE